MPTAAERRKPDLSSLGQFRKRDRVRHCHNPSLLLAIPTDLRRQLDKKFPHSAVTLIDGLIGVCRKNQFQLAGGQRHPASSHFSVGDVGEGVVDGISLSPTGPGLVWMLLYNLRAAIHFQTAMRQGLLHSQIEHWPRRSVPVSVVTGPDLAQQSS